MPVATQMFNRDGNPAIYVGTYDGISSLGTTSGYTDFLILDNVTETKLATVVDGWTWTPGNDWSGASWYRVLDAVGGGSNYVGIFKDNDNNLLFMLDDSTYYPGIARSTISKNVLLFNLPTN